MVPAVSIHLLTFVKPKFAIIAAMSTSSFGPRILIVDQDVKLLPAIAMPLYQAGYETATTRHKEEAIATLIENPHDVVIIDPFEGGGLLELLWMLRNDDLLGYPRIVVVTTHTAKARDALQNGMADLAFDKDGLNWDALAEALEP